MRLKEQQTFMDRIEGWEANPKTTQALFHQSKWQKDRI